MPVTKSKSMTAWKKHLPQSAVDWTPHDYQLEAAQFLIERRSAALYLDPGLGKTSVVFAVYKVLKQRRMSGGVLVVGPLRPIRRVWPKERDKWKDFKDITVAVLHGKGKFLAAKRHDFYCINYEGLDWLIKSKTLRVLLKKGWITDLVMDEITKMKNTKSMRFRQLRPFLEQFERRYGLTGSPAANGLLGLFGQCYALDLGETLGDHFSHYRISYFTPIPEAHVWVPVAGGEELIFKKIAPLALRMKAEDYMKLPELVDHVVPIYLEDKVMAHYDMMDEELLAMIDNNLFTAANAGVASGKCRQICSGAVYKTQVDPITGEPTGGKREWTWLHDEKLEALKELKEELNGQQLMVVYEYKHELERFKKHFGADIPVMAGAGARREAELEDSWNAGELDWLFCQPQSVGHGMNFQGSSAHHICMFTPMYNYELWDQIIRRLMRQGNDAQRLFLHTFAVPKTVDMVALATLKRRQRNQNDFFQAIVEYWADKRGIDKNSAEFRRALMVAGNGAKPKRNLK